MNRTDQIAYAIKFYPIGTIVTPEHVNGSKMEFTIRDHDFRFESHDKDKLLVNTIEEGDSNGSMALYYHGVWARIISSPVIISQVINDYSIY